MDEITIKDAAQAIASTPLRGLMDDEGLDVYILHLWPDEVGRDKLEETLRAMARSAITTWRQKNAPGES